ncbi:regulator of G-protein signaling 20 [Notothenia coriiceps]|uniref:Regulator of G-protein signaling 20 n=1 Tax=Notothenia coriiceps TaxID=8208 RepID=A0A6I9Q3P9_9TELE|nr:PREDICTED: regulator of G-protein signaling 17 [Notothenia coriiceps]
MGTEPKSLPVRNEEERRRRRRRLSQDTKMETIPNCEACTKPSMEEIRLWSQSFDKLMKNPAGRNVFREFLRTEYSEDNMLFWLACEDLKQEINKNAIEEKARSIYEDYISILSPKEVGKLPTENRLRGFLTGREAAFLKRQSATKGKPPPPPAPFDLNRPPRGVMRVEPQ